MQPEAFEACLPMIRALEALEVDYLVGGSLASSFHGTPRSTLDVDLVADLRPAHGPPLIAHLGDAFYAEPERITAAIAKRSSFNVIYLRTMFKVDVFVLGDDPLAKEEMRRRQRVDLGDGLTVEIASAEDVVLQKLLWYRMGNEVSDRQWNDLLGVIRVRGDQLDRDYLQQWAARLEITDLLERAFEG